MASANILGTPYDIYRAALQVFPASQAQIIVSPGGDIEVMKLSLSEDVQLSLSRQVKTEPFLRELRIIGLKLDNARLRGVREAIDINVGLFSSFDNPLSHWQVFRRTIYARDEQPCEDAIIDYLINPCVENEEILHALGLAPSDVESNPEKDDLSYFAKAKGKLKEFALNVRRSLGQEFLRKYPNITAILTQEGIENNIRETKDSSDDFGSILSQIKSHVIGQDNAAQKLAAMIASHTKTGKTQVCLFVGPTGVGKTEMAKAIATLKHNRLVSFAMNQYQEEHHVADLFGSPTGYVGSQDKPHLAKKLDVLNPTADKTVSSVQHFIVDNAVILFDELEKAHSKIKSSLLTILDEHYCDLNYTNKSQNIQVRYIFKRCIIAATSNLFASQIVQAFAQGESVDRVTELFKTWNSASQDPSKYAPEQLGRMLITPFGPIPRGIPYQTLLKAKWNRFLLGSQEVGTEIGLKEELECKEIEMENESEFFQILENKVYGNGTDFRKVVIDRFERFKQVIYSHKSEWGNLKLLKITFFAKQNNLFLKVSFFDDDLLIYSSYDKIPPLTLD